MQRDKLKICIIRVGGTNRDGDAAACLRDQGASVEILHLNDVLRRRNLQTYDGLVFPGGFAYGDYVRAGAIFAKRIESFLKEDLRAFYEASKPILGICNGFQVLAEADLLPAPKFGDPEFSLAANKSGRFECRWVTLRKNPNSNCIFTRSLEQAVKFPIAHGEGRFVMGDVTRLKELEANNQIALQYAKRDGSPANQSYPDNPNGSDLDIAGIASPSGTIFGLMPHPEDAYFGYQMPDWVEKREFKKYGDGLGIFKSMVDYLEEKF